MCEPWFTLAVISAALDWILDCWMPAWVQALMGLELDGKMTKPDFEFSGEGVRFDRRFRPFTAVSTPPIILYYKYKVCLLYMLLWICSLTATTATHVKR